MSERFPDSAVRGPVSLQRWEDLTFAHWAYRPDVVQALLPPGLRVQQWEGLTWVVVTPFRMADVRVPALPWPLLAATVTGELAGPLTAVGLPRPLGAPMVHAASAVHVRFGPPRPVGLSSSCRRVLVSP